MSRLVDQHGRLLQTLQIFSGRTGDLIAVASFADDPEEFDPWAPLPGDLDGDGLVTREDVLLLIASLGRSEDAGGAGDIGGAGGDLTMRDGDLDGNGRVDAHDLALVLAQLGRAALWIEFDGESAPTIGYRRGDDRPILEGIGGPGGPCPSCPGKGCDECEEPYRPNCCGYKPGIECDPAICPKHYDPCYCGDCGAECPENCTGGCNCAVNPCAACCDPDPCDPKCGGDPDCDPKCGGDPCDPTCDRFDPCDPRCDPPPDCGKNCSWLSLVMDFNNNDGFNLPSDDYDETGEIDPTEPPGKIVFTNIGDSDDDGVPDFADGYSHPDIGAEGDMAAARFTPLQILIHLEIDPEDVENYTLTFEYQVSDPQSVEVMEQGEAPYTWWEYELPAQGLLRLWTKDGNAARSALPIDDEKAPGDFVASGVAYPLADVPGVLYVETVRPGRQPGKQAVKATLTNTKTGESCSAELVLTAAEVEVHDLRHWEPEWDSRNETVQLGNSNLYAQFPGNASKVGGAITDGSSVCLLRLTPKFKELPQPLWDMTVRVAKRGAATTNQPRVVGTLTEPGPTSTLPMNLPTRWEDVAEDEKPSEANFGAGLAFYVPPDNYLDPDHNPGSDAVLNDEETCAIEFSFILNSEHLGATPFVLRRPPLVLVHGLYSSFETWDKSIWHGLQFDPDDPDDEPLPSPLKTRVYPLDYSNTHAMGYDDSWAWVPWMIQRVLLDYRGAFDGEFHHPTHGFRGVRYAANRADVAGHSMGGLLTRVYVSDLDIQGQAREKKNFWGNWVANSKWHKISVPRVPQPPQFPPPPSNEFGNNSGKWHFLRHQNYGAGDIRRFISIGTPFNGSPLADLGRGQIVQYKAEHAADEIWRWFNNQGQFGLIVDPETLVDHALIDLGLNSTFQRLLEQATYPTNQWKRHWHPIVGITGAIPPENWQNVWWNGIFSKVPSATLQVFNAGQSDLVVHQNSQANSRMFAATVFSNTVHSPNTIIQQNFNNLPETESAPIAERVLELLSTYDPTHWQGDLSQ